MGNPFSTTKASTSSANNQVGVQGGTGYGAATGAGVAYGAGGTAIAGGIYSGGAAINIMTSDIAALEANQAIALAAIQGSNFTTLNALEVASMSQANASELVAQLQAGANDVALKATPLSAGDVATSVTSALKPLMVVVGIVALGFIAVSALKKS